MSNEARTSDGPAVSLPTCSEFPRITFGIIVLNGEPFTAYCLRQIYPHAHEIIVVEGGSQKAIGEAPEGHSTDGTCEALARFKAEEDPENKIRIVSREGFWTEKHEQSQAYARIATGDYLWQVDIDEFYRHEDIQAVRLLLARSPEITAISFRQLTFWGAPTCVADSFFLRAQNASEYHRLFRWGSGYRYTTHRPPTVVDNHGRDLRRLKWLNADQMERLGIRLFHYSLLFPHQVTNKSKYYATPGKVPEQGGYTAGSDRWAEECYLQLRRPFRVHNVFQSVSWLRSYAGPHPKEALRMWQDVETGDLAVRVRPMQDVRRLLADPKYRIAAALLTFWSNLWRMPMFNSVLRAWLGSRARLSNLLSRFASRPGFRR